MSESSRQRMIVSAAELIRERGVQATAFSDVIAHSKAPRGSIYHHFPGGKTQLIEEATEFAGEVIAAGLVAALGESEPVPAVHQFVAAWNGVLEASDFAAGCPVVAAALEGERMPGARDRAGAVFAEWIAAIASALTSRGVESAAAQALATTIVAAIEGAIVLARAQRSSVPLTQTAEQLEVLITAALGAAR